MTIVSSTRVSLRFGGPDLDSDEISGLLGGGPDYRHTRGEPMPKGRGLWREGMWSRQVAVAEPGDLDAQIAALLESLSPDPSVWEALGQRYDANVFVGLFLADSNEGVSLDPSTLQLLSERRLRLDLDIYYSGSPQADDGEIARNSVLGKS